MEECKIENLYNLDETIAKELLETVTYPWEALPKIADFIVKCLSNSSYYRTCNYRRKC